MGRDINGNLCHTVRQRDMKMKFCESDDRRRCRGDDMCTAFVPAYPHPLGSRRSQEVRRVVRHGEAVQSIGGQPRAILEKARQARLIERRHEATSRKRRRQVEVLSTGK